MRTGQGRLCSEDSPGNPGVFPGVFCECCSEHPSCSPAHSSPIQIKMPVALPSLPFEQSPVLQTHLAFRFQGLLPAWGVSLHPSTPQSLPAFQPLSPFLSREYGSSFKAVPASGLQFLSLEERSELLSPCCDQIPDKSNLGEEGLGFGLTALGDGMLAGARGCWLPCNSQQTER